MAERDASIYLESDVFLHDVFIVERGEITSFVLQLEVYEDGVWHPVVRCDSAHGEAHIDYINPGGREYNKTWLGVTAPFNTIYQTVSAEFKSTYRACRPMESPERTT